MKFLRPKRIYDKFVFLASVKRTAYFREQERNAYNVMINNVLDVISITSYLYSQVCHPKKSLKIYQSIIDMCENSIALIEANVQILQTILTNRRSDLERISSGRKIINAYMELIEMHVDEKTELKRYRKSYVEKHKKLLAKQK